MRARLQKLIQFIRCHRMFVLFFILSMGLNTWLFLHEKREDTEFITCSSYDRGPLGTFAFYEHLAGAGFPVQRVRVPVYRALDPKHDRGKTLFMLSPRISPGSWEWDKITQWISAGNRLITSGIYGPSRTLFQKRDFTIASSHVLLSSARVLLPLDSSFQTGTRLNPNSVLGSRFVLNRVYKESDSVFLTYFLDMPPDMMPFVSAGNKVMAVKQLKGEGEWVAFTPMNVFSNTLLNDSTWYQFAVNLSSESQYCGKLLFDEYHNGFRATQNLWQLLEYYRFDKGIIFLFTLGLAFLFQQGVRILPPRPLSILNSKSTAASLSAMSMLLYRYNAWKGLLRRDLQSINEFLFNRIVPENIGAEDILNQYQSKGGSFPPEADSPEKLKKVLAAIREGTVIKEDVLTSFNILVHMRKDLKL